MKYTTIIATAVSTIAFSQLVLAQTAACPAQNILDTCLSNEDNYLKTCIDQDYNCLCKWHKAKLSCFDNCPNNPGRASEQGLKDTFCSISETYNATTSSAAVVSPTVVAATTLPSNSVPVASPSTSKPTTSSASSFSYGGQGALLLAVGISSYFFI